MSAISNSPNTGLTKGGGRVKPGHDPSLWLRSIHMGGVRPSFP